MEAHEAYKQGQVDTALLKYAMLADLGYEVAQSNVAYILDHGTVHCLFLSCRLSVVMETTLCSCRFALLTIPYLYLKVFLM
jgi:SEL1 protein